MTKSSGSTTQKTTTEPWSEAQPYQKAIMGEASYGYQNSMLSPAYYPGATYIGPSPQEMAGLSQQEALANQGNPLATASMNQAGQMISGGGMTGQQQDILNPLTNIAMGTNGQTINTGNTYGDIYGANQGPTAAQTYGNPIASGQQGITTSGLYGNTYQAAAAPTASQTYGSPIASGQQGIATGNLYGNTYEAAAAPTTSSSNLTGMAAGEQIGANNANTMASLDYAAQQAGDAVNSAMNGAGRYGSDVAQTALAGTIGNIYSTGLMNQQNIDTQNMMGANAQVDAANQAAMSQQLAAAGGLTGVQGANIQNQLGAAGQMDTAQQQALATQLGAASGITGVQGQNIGNQLGAAGLMDTSQNAQAATQLGAVGGQTGVQAANLANQAGASQALNSAYDTASNTALNYANAAPNIYESQYAPSQHLIDVGAAYRGEEQAQLQDQINRYYGTASQFSNNLNAYNNLINGVTSGYNTTTAQAPQGSPIAGMLGGASMASGLTSNMGYTDPYSQAIAALGGAAVGML